MLKYNQTNQYITYEQMNLINDFRALWTDVIIWLRSYMVSVATGFSDVNAILNRINRIPEEFNQKIQPFLGADRSAQFQQLISMYLLHAETMINALNSDDQAAADEAAAALYKDADLIADFLASVSPYWSKGQWQNLLYHLTELSISEVIALYSGDYTKEISIRSRMLKHALVLGDYTASGVMHYLPPGTSPPPGEPDLGVGKQNPKTYITYGQMNLINDFRALWTELIIWMRSYMVSTMTGFSNIDSIRDQINRIPGELAQSLQPFLGIEISDQFQYLLSMYLYRAQEVVNAQQSGDQQVFENALASFYQDTDNMVDFLANIHPYWNKSQWQNLFYQLNELILAQMTALLSGEYEKEIEIRDRMQKLALVLGDYMAAGVMHYLSPALPEIEQS